MARVFPKPLPKRRKLHSKKRTQSKIARMFEFNEGEMRYMRREVTLNAPKLVPKACLANCGRPMLVAPGQLAYFHSECRHKKRTYEPIISRK